MRARLEAVADHGVVREQPLECRCGLGAAPDAQRRFEDDELDGRDYGKKGQPAQSMVTGFIGHGYAGVSVATTRSMVPSGSDGYSGSENTSSQVRFATGQSAGCCAASAGCFVIGTG